MNSAIRYSRKDHLINLVLVMFFILPQNMLFYLFVPISLLFVYDKRRRVNTIIATSLIILIAEIVISLLVNVNTPWFNQKSVLRAIQLSLLLFCFGRLKSIRIIKGYLIFLVFYLAIFQFAYQLNLPFVGSLMNTIYPIDAEALASYSFRQEMSFSDIGGYTSRLGGFYYNSNNCAFFLESLLLCLVLEKNQFKASSFYIYVVILVVCIFSTGSRTSFLVLVLVAISAGMTSFNAKSAIGYALAIVAFFIFYNNIGSSFRIFQVSQGMDDSFSDKVAILMNYLYIQDSLIRILFGSFSTSCLPVMFGADAFAGTDFELGDIIVTYGFLWLISLIVFLAQLFFLLKKQYRCLFCILLWSFSNTIFLSYRGASVFLLILSIYYIKSQEERTTELYIKANYALKS